MQRASSREFGVLELLGLGDGEGRVEGREAVANGVEVDSHSCCRETISALAHDKGGGFRAKGGVERTLNEPGTILRQVFNDDIAAPVSQEPIER